jgi:hypothetical protein
MYEKTVRYGESGVMSDERFEIKAVTHDEEGIHWGANSFVRLRDEDSGEEWTLDQEKAQKLANALLGAVRYLKRWS